MLGAAVVFAASATAQSALTQSIYLNAHYCAGVAEVYGERLGEAGIERAKAGEARRVAETLKRDAVAMGRSYHVENTAKAKSADAHGRRVMTNLLPANGGWVRDGNIPREALRQYEQCASMVSN